MARRYCIEITEGLSTHYCFSFIDTVDGLARILFDHMKIDVVPDMEFHGDDDDPYRIVMVKIPRSQREAFLKAIELLPGLMRYAGMTDYEDYCRMFFADARQFLSRGQDAGRITSLQ